MANKCKSFSKGSAAHKKCMAAAKNAGEGNETQGNLVGKAKEAAGKVKDIYQGYTKRT